MKTKKDKGRWVYQFTCEETGYKVWKRYTNETSEDVIKFLEDKNLNYILNKANNISIFTQYSKFSYYYTTGRWAELFKCAFHDLKPQYYKQGKDMEDLNEKILKPTIEKEIKNLGTTDKINDRYIYETTTGKNFSETYYPKYIKS